MISLVHIGYILSWQDASLALDYSNISFCLVCCAPLYRKSWLARTTVRTSFCLLCRKAWLAEDYSKDSLCCAEKFALQKTTAGIACLMCRKVWLSKAEAAGSIPCSLLTGAMLSAGIRSEGREEDVPLASCSSGVRQDRQQLGLLRAYFRREKLGG